MRKVLRVLVVAAFVAVPFTATAPAANAACTDLTVVEVCNEGMGGIGLDIPGLIHVCVRLGGFCGS